MSKAALLFLYSIPRLWSQHTARRTHVVAACRKEALQFSAVGARQAEVIGRPRGNEGTTTAQTIGQVHDRQRVRLGSIVPIDRGVIVEDEEGRPAGPRGEVQARVQG